MICSIFLLLLFSIHVVFCQKPKIIISELMYANEPPNVPSQFANSTEFIEFKNLEDRDIDLSGWTVGGFGYTFSAGEKIQAKGFYVLARIPSKFEKLYKVKANNRNSIVSRLSNKGERITLRNGPKPISLVPEEQTANDVVSIQYETALPWPEMADDRGFSLVPINPNEMFDHDDALNWRASSARNGSPGRDDPPSTVPQLLINEIQTNPILTNNQQDFVEIYNPHDYAVTLDHWCLTDILSNITRFQFPVGTGEIAPKSLRVVYEDEFQFGLSSKGNEKVFLVSHDGNQPTGWAHGLSFEAAPLGKSFIRFVNGVNQELFVLSDTPTPGTVNAEPTVATVYIAEIDYNPTLDDVCKTTSACEYIRIENSLNVDVDLFEKDLKNTPWRIGGMNFTLPKGVVLPANGDAYITPADPTEFKRIKSLPTNTLVFGPTEGSLSNGGETLSLYKPLPKDEVDVEYPFFAVDRVRYSDKTPWPTVADGSGEKLYRCDPSKIGNDASNWGIKPDCERETVMPTPAARPTSPPVAPTAPPTPAPSTLSVPTLSTSSLSINTNVSPLATTTNGNNMATTSESEDSAPSTTLVGLSTAMTIKFNMLLIALSFLFDVLFF